jgi:hypothetical protein
MKINVLAVTYRSHFVNFVSVFSIDYQVTVKYSYVLGLFVLYNAYMRSSHELEIGSKMLFD